MAAYTVLEPPARANRRPIDHAVRFVFLREGFSFWAFLFAGLWLLWRRLWLVFIIYLTIAIALEYGLAEFGIPSSARGIVFFLVHLLIGLEAAALRRWTLLGHGWRDRGVVIADDLEMAERRFFDARAARAPASAPIEPPAPSPLAARAGLGGPDVIGLFPEPGGGR